MELNVQKEPKTSRLVTCAVCGCNDAKQCDRGCSWSLVDRSAGFGICNHCAGAVTQSLTVTPKRLGERLIKSRGLMRKLLEQVGNRGTCGGCGTVIYWVQHKNGIRTAYTTEGSDHLLDCLKRAEAEKA